MDNMINRTLQQYYEQARTIWVLITDGERIRIVETGDAAGPPREVDVNGLVEAVTRAGAMRDVSRFDDQESRQGENVMINAAPVKTNFAHITVAILEQAQSLGLFDQLVVIAPHGIFDQLIGILNRDVRESLMLELEADLIDADSAVIRATLPI